MITNVSFTSNYSTSIKAPKTKHPSKKAIRKENEFRKFKAACDSLSSGLKGLEVNSNYKVIDRFPYMHHGSVTLCAPDNMDEIIEGYLNYHNIQYQKTPNNKE